MEPRSRSPSQGRSPLKLKAFLAFLCLMEIEFFVGDIWIKICLPHRFFHALSPFVPHSVPVPHNREGVMAGFHSPLEPPVALCVDVSCECLLVFNCAAEISLFTYLFHYVHRSVEHTRPFCHVCGDKCSVGRACRSPVALAMCECSLFRLT